ILVADDPGPISSQTEQDTRNFAQFSKIPCFDPSSAKEAYDMVEDAFDYSERYKTPVILRSTTRVCHGYASIEIKDENEFTKHTVEGFIKDTSRWVIFPRLSYANHKKIVARNEELSEVFSGYKRNLLNGDKNISKKGIATGGISYTYVMESLASNEEYKNFSVFKVATPYPFPEKLAVGFLTGLDEVLCIEELDPVIEKELVYICGKYNLDVKIRGKLTHDIQVAGENSIDSVSQAIGSFASVNLSNTIEETKSQEVDPSILPVRPPVLCAGCPHRASFYAVKQAMKGQKTIFCGDIGCYTMGNAMPLDMCDTCLCMGAGLGIAQGVGHVEADTKCFAFVGDSTFFASAITGVINAVYNGADMTLVVLDNSTTAMTGHQPHPGTGRTAMGDVVEKISIENVLKGIGLQFVKTVDPLDYQLSVATVKEASELRGVKAIIFKSPCIVLNKPTNKLVID
ncbi:MAG TPA: thiamine pyrophosphate-dependent enzyme, partial [Saccharofermentans sp.]|nr:thiamine pyrophosphate-dependent enzyme [Saccharofermentans sp.]